MLINLLSSVEMYGPYHRAAFPVYTVSEKYQAL